MFYSFMGEKPLIIEWSFISIMGTFEFVSGVSTHMMREEVGAPSRGRCPLWAAAPLLLYKDGWSTSSLLAHLLALWLVSSPSSADPPYELWLRRSPAEIVSPPTPPRRSAVGLSRWILYFFCPAGTRDQRSSSSRTCDRVRKCCPFVALIFFTILRSALILYVNHENRSH